MQRRNHLKKFTPELLSIQGSHGDSQQQTLFFVYKVWALSTQLNHVYNLISRTHLQNFGSLFYLFDLISENIMLKIFILAMHKFSY